MSEIFIKEGESKESPPTSKRLSRTIRSNKTTPFLLINPSEVHLDFFGSKTISLRLVPVESSEIWCKLPRSECFSISFYELNELRTIFLKIKGDLK